MLNIKPNNFPVKPYLDGSEELYTQVGALNQKFTTDTLAEYILSGVDYWDYQEVEFGLAELSILAFTPIQILDEALLAPNEYYEINRIIIEYTHLTSEYAAGGVTPSFYFVDNINFLYYQFQEIPINFIEENESVIRHNYSNETHAPYARNTGLYIKSSNNITSGDGTFKVKVYYKISS